MTTRRRDILKMLGIGGAAGLAGCSRTAPDPLVSPLDSPEELARGEAVLVRSTCRECPAGCGIEARVLAGRVQKLEGNPDHPVNAGGLCARGQAAVQGLYHPDRFRTPLVRNPQGGLEAASWDGAFGRVVKELAQLDPKQILVITGAATGALAEVAGLVGRHLRYEAIGYEALREANRLTFGIAAIPVLRFAEARAIYVFATDVTATFLSPVGYARGISEARRGGGRMVYIGSRLSLTGAHADEWVSVEAGTEGRLAMALVRELLAGGGSGHLPPEQREKLRRWSDPFTPERAGVAQGVIRELARELREKPALAVTGGVESCGPAAVATAVAVNLLNLASGAVNRTVRFDRASALESLARPAELLALEGARAVLIAETNPVYSCPGFAEAIQRIPLVVALASQPDETTEAAHVILPVSTPLESWGDYEPWSGVHSLQQPAMRPVFDTRAAGEVLLELAKALRRDGASEPDFRELLRNRWRKLAKGDFEAFWRDALQRGGWWGEVPRREVTLRDADLSRPLEALLSAPPAQGFRLQTYPSLAHFDGRSASRPWLQELPDPVTQVAWGNSVELNPQDAARLGVRRGDLVRVRSPHGEVQLPAYPYPGIRRGEAAIPLGGGHAVGGRYATGVGANAVKLLDRRPDPATGGIRWCGERVEISLVKRGEPLAVIAGNDFQHHRGIARSRVVPGPQKEHHAEHPVSMYAPHAHPQHHWGMVIDLDACTGCSACVVACYAENNIRVAGPEEARRGRIMSWIRLERFFGPGDKLSEPFQVDWIPMLCQHCDLAPCEAVCPVYAAYHTPEGLNAQIYNRCVGTRYCANNCPYKVRRFNWYEGRWPAPLDWQLNPDVTVRSKGVMEKCTFCVQRIVAAKERARREGRKLADGDVTPACAQSCPTRAIVFGDLSDPASAVSRAGKDPRAYLVFEELNTRPAVTYLERWRRKV